ncbi:hypothetical protein C361_03096 [Cryptococcus neoformans Tu259-1]|uniref:Uncharacterized protein n=1 Tax=Cryptococcus neoformans Tu259-1 TaxID=1230072 RepID=A0A854QEX9_CRYNE|nr:hypothetical protein C361_03096 [Cryptococcus neoformans var. grubii Tu259-1]
MAGWIVLKLGVQDSDNGVWAAVAVSIMLLPGTAAWLAIFVMLSRPAHYDRQAKSRLSNVRRAAFGAGGISHSTLCPRILPLSSATTCVGVILAGVLGDSARYIILAWTATYIAILVGCGAMGLWQMARTPRKGMIRLRGESRMSMYEEKSDFILAEKGEEGLRVGATCLDGNANGLEQLKRSDSWVSSPSHRQTLISSFEYSSETDAASSYRTPKSKLSSLSLKAPQFGQQSIISPSSSHHLSPDHQDISSEGSWLSHDTNSQSTISEWSFPSPEPAITRPRSLASPAINANLPKPGQTRMPGGLKSSDTTAYTGTLTSTPGSAICSPDGSMLAAYSPDPFRPMPRGFESLTSYPISSSQLGESRVSLAPSRVTTLMDTAGNVPVEMASAKQSSTWRTQNYQSFNQPMASGTTLANSLDLKTPDAKSRSHISVTDHRAPPPPPIPSNMPLPPTPMFARSSTLWEMSSSIQGKESMEMLLGGEEGVWVPVDEQVAGAERWGVSGRGVGIVAVAGNVACFTLGLPFLLHHGRVGHIANVLYLVSLLLPCLFLSLTSYILRYRLSESLHHRVNIGSTKSASTGATGHKSLALISESQLSLPVSISPKLTPPHPKLGSVSEIHNSNLNVSRLVHRKPSLTTYVTADKDGSSSHPGRITFADRSPTRRHTVYGNFTMRDLEAEEVMRKNLSRKSGDVWIQNGHAIEGGGFMSRAAEMFKPVPAMRVLVNQPLDAREKNTVKNLRGGVVSMIAKRTSGFFEGRRHSALLHAEAAGTTAGQYEEACVDGTSSACPLASSPRSLTATNFDTERPLSHASGHQSFGSTDEVNTLPAVQIYHATRGRMSNGPTLIFGKRMSNQRLKRTISVGEGAGLELDWLTDDFVPNLRPSVDIRSDPSDEQTQCLPHTSQPDKQRYDITEQKRPLSEQFDCNVDAENSYTRAPSFHNLSFKDQSTPHQSRRPSDKHHIYNQSSSVDSSRSPECYAVESSSKLSKDESTQNAHTLVHKSSFGLPRLKEEDFTADVRKSFEELSRPIVRYDVQSAGIDLPPIPRSLTIAHHNLSPVTENKEDSFSETSMILSRSCVEDMHLALQLDASSFNQSIAQGTKEHVRTVQDSEGSFLASPMSTKVEDAVEEMERMMAMDTPTREDFVVPPSFSTTAPSGRLRSASDISMSTSSSSAVTDTKSDNCHFGGLTKNGPPIPITPPAYRQPPGLPTVVSHPHPPPLARTPSSTFGLREQTKLRHFCIPEPHPPVQRLLPKQSSDSIYSTSRIESESSDKEPTFSPKIRGYQPSKMEMKIAKQLDERNRWRSIDANSRERREVAEKPAIRSAVQHNKGSTFEPTVRSGPLKPLQVIVEKQANRTRLNNPKPASKAAKGFSVLLHDGQGGPKVSLDGRSEKGKGKENARGSKASSSSATVCVKGLRA